MTAAVLLLTFLAMGFAILLVWIESPIRPGAALILGCLFVVIIVVAAIPWVALVRNRQALVEAISVEFPSIRPIVVLLVPPLRDAIVSKGRGVRELVFTVAVGVSENSISVWVGGRQKQLVMQVPSKDVEVLEGHFGGYRCIVLNVPEVGAVPLVLTGRWMGVDQAGVIDRAEQFRREICEEHGEW